MNFIRKLLDVFYVRRCIVCGRGIDVSEDICICKDCDIKMKRVGYTVETPDREIISPLPYTGNIRRAMSRFKFRNKKYLGRTFGKLLCRRVSAKWNDIDCIVCVPMKGRDRLYNQSAVIAGEVAHGLGVPFLENALIKVKDNKPFYKLGIKERMKLVKGAFDVGDDLSFAGKKVLLVDDIHTTGCTIGECRRVLSMNGAVKVYCATACFGSIKNLYK